MFIKSIIRNDSYLGGILFALVLVILTTCLIIPGGRLVQMYFPVMNFTDSGILLLSLIPGVIFMRFFILKGEFHKTGRGILILTFVLTLLYFFFIHNKPFNFPI